MRKLIMTAVALTGLAGAIAPVASAAPGRHVAEPGRDRDRVPALRRKGREIADATARLESKLGRRPQEHEIAAELKITEDTVKFHRGHIMRKMRAGSLADLVRMAENLGIR